MAGESDGSRRILFTAFEPSGDTLAAEVISALRRAAPSLEIVALGGPKMEAAGAELLEDSARRGTMHLDALAQARAHRRRLRRLRGRLAADGVSAVVPVDSPAANWSVCRAVRELCPAATIVHLVAPQLWAWAAWRIRRLRRLTDHVLCVLPFEPQWLSERGVAASFVGHPAFDPRRIEPARAGDLPAGTPKLALLPGSRPGEIARNWPTMLEAFGSLRAARPALAGAVAVHDDDAKRRVHAAAGGRPLPAGLFLVTGRTDAALDWCDAALVVSGTATLHAAARARPMVVIYNMSRLAAAAGRRIVRTPTWALPNLVAEWDGLGRAVPEFVPHAGPNEPIVRALERLLDEPEARRLQREKLAGVAARFGDLPFGETAAQRILAVLGRGPAEAWVEPKQLRDPRAPRTGDPGRGEAVPADGGDGH